MATELIGVKVDVEVKQRITDLITSGKYRNISDFLHRAIKSQLELDESGINIKEEIARIQDTLRDMNIRLSKLE